ncbi:unnamed protein product [Microthlaspi erraticum]|uniref:F-box associated beta-propeller type 1 domain-containing protein n=1 Tax=Microthlaspi erraticum TaxID=1685480 RepID=A0A6D2KTX6_9BRAS|nr:unnamed protein product [Microthlaspi erraticum]CAA7045855.1 unnamed protein product [Microthlaspi erraticum]CAA7054976.1 unnamed protein product [Microthlaspi erraticum]CAA7057861.1 unnamed protein product [Microthlaspi erraticum]
MEIFRALPEELVEEEILTQVPATYLKGLGSTCKRWNRLFTGDRRFARNHTDKAAKQFLGLMLTNGFRICPIIDGDGQFSCLELRTELSIDDPYPKYPGAQFDVGAVFHCDGFLLCTNKDRSRFVVWNPFTGFTRWVQPSCGGTRGSGFALGYYGENKSYKVLSYRHRKNDFEIYEFSSDTWRVVGDDAMPPGWSIGYSAANVSLKGSCYWFASGVDETKTHSFLSLLRFDFSTEKCVPVPLPYECRDVPQAACVSVVKDEKLSVLLQRERTSKTEIWVSNKIDENGTTQVVSWSKVLSLDLSPDLQLCEMASFLLDEEKKVVVIYVSWMDEEDDPDFKSKELIYIVEEDSDVTTLDFGSDDHPGALVGVLNYVPSLAQMEQAGGKRKRADFRV